MPTTAPPILIWQPGGGIPVGPVSNPPVYSQAGTTQLVEDQAYIDVVFDSIQTTDEWVLVECIVVNETDGDPLNIWPGLITDKTAAGFRLQLNGLPDSGNYYLHWAVSGINIAPTPATTFALSGPASGGVGVPSTFTVHLPASTTGAATVTPSDGGDGGTFSPTTVTLTTGAPPATFTYTPATAGTKTISVSNTAGLVNPVDLSFLAINYATEYSMSGPSAGIVSVASTAFTVTLTPGGYPVPATVTVTPSDSGGGGTFTPSTVTLTTASPSTTFTYTPGSVGTKTISATNNGGLTDPANLSYVSSAFDPSAISGLKGWYKADSLVLSDGAAVATWADSSSNANDLAQATAGKRPIYKTNIVNSKPVVRFDGVDDWLITGVNNPGITDFTIFVAHQTSGDSCLIGTSGGGYQLFAVGGGGSNIMSFYDGASNVLSSTLGTVRTSWNIGCIRRSGSTVSFFESGVARGTGTSLPALSATQAEVGTWNNGAALFTTGDIAEILIYDAALSSTDRGNVEDYLQAKFAIP